MPGWRNGRRPAFRKQYPCGVWVRLPLPAPMKAIDLTEEEFYGWLCEVSMLEMGMNDIEAEALGELIENIKYLYDNNSGTTIALKTK